MSLTRGAKRKMEDGVLFPDSRSISSTAILIGQSLLLLEIPGDANMCLPVWEAIGSQQVDISWTVNPYSISVLLAPITSKRKNLRNSSKGEPASSVAQTLPSSSTTLQPGMVFNFFTQQSANPQNAPHVLLKFPQNGIQLPEKTQPPPSTSVIVPLPVLITQVPAASQPSTPTEKSTIPSIQAPTASPKVPVPFPFHTKESSDVEICDNFLLGLCNAGKKCKMHHTLYPFHWQLWCVTKYEWIDFPPRSQVLLERMYSNVNQEAVCIKEGSVWYSLNFETMEVEGEDDPPKYACVRQLTNSDSPLRNPYFPNKWKFYWWNNFSWTEYSKSVSTVLRQKMITKEPKCSFYIGSQQYKVDFTSMLQTNVTTGFQREIRWRPVYRSPESMQPYLKTAIQTDSTSPPKEPPSANFTLDPLEEFGSWYPPVWCLASQQDYSLVNVPAGTFVYNKVQSFFHKSFPETEVVVVSIQQVQNLLHWDKYQRHKVHMQKQYDASKEPLERHLFHGTTKKASASICRSNFDPRVAGVNGVSFGYGTYFATEASMSNRFSATAVTQKVRHMFLAKVLVGKVSVGKADYRLPPLLYAKTMQYKRYDTCVDRIEDPTIFVVFDSCQCYPYYLIKYKKLPVEVDIH